jgi:ABC-2 type transport system permease protein
MRPYLTATRYALLELARNRFAFGLLLLFVPVWFGTLVALIPGDSVPFKLGATGAFIQASGRDLTALTAGLNALTLIVGFLMFAATRKAAAFDRRLVLCGYSQRALVAAKLTALTVASVVIALYSAAVLLVFWRPENIALVWLSYVLAALIYGGLGILLGVLVRSELAGFFLIIMVSLFDTLLQNPVENPVANAAWLKYLPAYGPTQVGVAGGFTSAVPWLEALVGLAWFAGFALAGLLIFSWRTRRRGARMYSMPHTPAAPSVEAASVS